MDSKQEVNIHIGSQTIYQAGSTHNEGCQQIYVQGVADAAALMRAFRDTPTQSQPTAEETDEKVVKDLCGIFYGNEEEARKFLHQIRGMKNTEIVALVKKRVNEGIISELSCHRDLWKILHDNGLYTATESNWNMQL